MKVKKNIILNIDTSSNKEIKIGLSIDGKEFVTEQQIDYRRAQATLPLIEKILKGYKLTLQDLTAIKVNAGPGSFTGLRVGVSIANALGYLLKIPINGKKVEEIVEPTYE